MLEGFRHISSTVQFTPLFPEHDTNHTLKLSLLMFDRDRVPFPWYEAVKLITVGVRYVRGSHHVYLYLGPRQISYSVRKLIVELQTKLISCHHMKNLPNCGEIKIW